MKIGLRLLILFFLIFSLFSSPVVAEETLFKPTNEQAQATEYKQPMSGGEVTWMLVRVVLALLLICVLIYLLVKFLAKRSQPFTSPRALRIIAGIGVAPQKTVQIVEIGQKVYILGIGQDIRVLDKLEDPAEIAVLLEGLEHSTVFNDNLIKNITNQWRSRFQSWFKKKDVMSEELDAEEYEKMFSEQLKEANDRQGTVGQWMDENKERSNES
jgi:flagellar protein FliO/FliZ